MKRRAPKSPDDPSTRIVPDECSRATNTGYGTTNTGYGTTNADARVGIGMLKGGLKNLTKRPFVSR